MHTKRQSKTSRILELATVNKMLPHEIAEHPDVDMTPQCVRSVLSRARRKGAPIPRFGACTKKRLEHISVIMTGRVVPILRKEADRRGLTPSELSHLLLEAAANDDMINAILDDDA